MHSNVRHFGMVLVVRVTILVLLHKWPAFSPKFHLHTATFWAEVYGTMVLCVVRFLLFFCRPLTPWCTKRPGDKTFSSGSVRRDILTNVSELGSYRGAVFALV